MYGRGESVGKGAGGRASLSMDGRYVSRLWGGPKLHVLASPFELYEMMADVNRLQTPRRLAIAVGTTGEKDPYVAMNTAARNTESCFARMVIGVVSQSIETTGGRLGRAEPIPNTTYGYGMGSFLGAEGSTAIDISNLQGGIWSRCSTWSD